MQANEKILKILVNSITWLFIFLWIYAAMSKLLDFQQFHIQLGQSPLLHPFVNLVAWTVPLLELLIAVFLLVSKTRLTGLYLSFSLMVLFTAYIVAIMGLGDHIPCACGGILQDMDWKQHLVFNSILTILGLIAIISDRPDKDLLLQQSRQSRKPV